MQTRLRCLAAIAAAFSLLCNSAQAAGTAFASISNVRFAVADLTPDDGIAAGYGIGELRSELSAFTLLEHQSRSPAPYQAGQVRVGNAAYYSQASVGNGVGELTVESVADRDLGMFRTIQGLSQQTIWLTLQPHTALTIGGQAAALAERLPGQDVDYFVESYLDIFLADQEWNELQWLKYQSLVLPGADRY